MTGGLGKLMTVDEYEVWLCDTKHECAPEGDMMCFTFNEKVILHICVYMCVYMYVYVFFFIIVFSILIFSLLFPTFAPLGLNSKQQN